jgi:3-hydroxy-D-aspartate aldolase
MISRRSLLASALAAPAFAARPFRYADVEAKIAKRDFSGITKEDLPTPAMVVNLAAFERNLKTMATYTKANGIDLRAHCKIHKSTNIAKRQVALGSLGITCATVAEAELMVGAGIPNVLYSSQAAGKNKIARTIALAAKDPTFMCVADDPLTVDLFDEAAAAAKIKLNVLVDLHAGLTRAGHATGEPGLKLAQDIDRRKNLKFMGVMGYSGGASHTKGWEQRREKSIRDVKPVVDTALLCRKSGLNVALITGGSTGTYNIDKEIGLTELQAGSYIFMDTAYEKVGGKTDATTYTDFVPSMAVLTTVISQNHKGQVTIDCGNKALLKPTDRVLGRPEVTIENQGAEYGILKWTDGKGFKLGERAELLCTTLDMSTNVYDRYYVFEGEKLVDVWPIMGRAGALQR